MADNFYTYLNDKGLVIPDASTIQAGLVIEFQSIFGADIDTSPETPIGRMIDTLTAERAGILGINAENANTLNSDLATGVYLDAIGSMFGVVRIGATSTQVSALVAGVAGTVIPAGSQAKTAAGDIFYLQSAVTLPSVGAVTFLSLVDGAIPCGTGELNSIVSPVIGWESVLGTASEIGTEVETDEAYRIRIRGSRYSGTGFLGDLYTALNEVPDINSHFAYDNGTGSPVTYDTLITIPAHSVFVVADGGSDADVARAIYESKSGGCGYTAMRGAWDATFSGVGTNGKIITVGGTTYTLKTTLTTSPSTIPNEVKIGATAAATATNLFLALTAGSGAGTNYSTGTVANTTCTATNPSSGVVHLVQLTGNYGTALITTNESALTLNNTLLEQSVTQSVLDPNYSVSYPVIFNRPAPIAIDVAITVRSQNYTGSSLSDDVKAAIISWAAGEVEGVDGLKIGVDVSPFEIAAAVSYMIPAPYVQDCKICVHGGSPAATTLTIYASQIATISTANITVTVV